MKVDLKHLNLGFYRILVRKLVQEEIKQEIGQCEQRKHK